MKSLYLRICMVTLSTIIVSSLCGFLVSNIYYHAKLKPFNDAKLSRMLDQVRLFLEQEAADTAGSPGPGITSDADKYLQSVGALGYELYLTNGTGKDRYYGGKFRVTDLKEQQVKSVLAGQAYHGVANFPGGPLITGFFENRLTNTVGAKVMIGGQNYALFMRPDTKAQFGELRSFFAMILLFTVLFSILLFLIATGHVVRPVTRLTEATKAIASGRYDIKLHTRRRDEIGQLATHFERMSREIQRSDQSRKEFVSNVSHEIQSPLASIQGFAAALRKQGSSPEEQEHYLSIIEQETRRLASLSKQLLTLSMLDDKQAEGFAAEPVLLREQLRQAAQVLEYPLAEKEIALLLNMPELTAAGNGGLLYQVWMNLLANAVKFTPSGGTIKVRAWKEGEWCKVAVTDSGEGIAAEELPLVFDRFYKTDKSRERTSSGTGLGLSIVRKIITLHKGTIEVESTVGEGSTFTVSLPAFVN
ncbi:hypothetical protein AWM70_12820 [Paenibacillus yonginensis]|uniref:Heme sensor protein HssS n=1 Tax=Paenibacillus yonginensis TaxID=1462996 RepID=A0A1B1N1R9_9BACL|nr:HAMP domain-containing sensor histidine kinase [Paenibacillus yonginensis]ANS75382.1 hypothetical protein AWM70_12820 [Paenibacillus yonginensis]